MSKYKTCIALACALSFSMPTCLLAQEKKKSSGIKKHTYYRHYYAHHSGAKSVSDKEWDKIKQDLEQATPDKKSLISQRLQQLQEIQKNPSGLAFYEPTYVLPVYDSTSVSPWYAQHPGSTPDNQKVMHTEAKAQLSVLFPVWTNIFHTPWNLSISYTQLNYWQLYAKSPYFRETNYEPQAFLSYTGVKNWLFSAGFDHESNGRGGTGYNGMERSWNRAFMNISFSGTNWFVSLMPWVLVFKSSSSNLHNPNIAHYLGYGRTVMAYKLYRQELSFMFRNVLESGFSRGAFELTYTFPLYGKLKGMVTFFSGYGQSLIEYDHYTNAYGLGIALSDWM